MSSSFHDHHEYCRGNPSSLHCLLADTSPTVRPVADPTYVRTARPRRRTAPLFICQGAVVEFDKLELKMSRNQQLYCQYLVASSVTVISSPPFGAAAPFRYPVQIFVPMPKEKRHQSQLQAGIG